MMGLRFFEPDKKMIEWLRSYIGNRLPVDVGCGDCELLIELGKKGVGIDPLTTIDRLESLMQHGIHVMPMQVELCGSFLKGLGNGRAIMIIARPCHSPFVENAIALAPEGMEILYITKPSNLVEHLDLGRFDKLKKLVKHKGKGKENEVVYSIMK
jgi:hypothetical protein